MVSISFQAFMYNRRKFLGRPKKNKQFLVPHFLGWKIIKKYFTKIGTKKLNRSFIKVVRKCTAQKALIQSSFDYILKRFQGS